MDQDGFFCVDYNVSFLGGNVVIVGGPSRQALSQRSQAKKNLQPKHHQDLLQQHEQQETNNR